VGSIPDRIPLVQHTQKLPSIHNRGLAKYTLAADILLEVGTKARGILREQEVSAIDIDLRMSRDLFYEHEKD